MKEISRLTDDPQTENPVTEWLEDLRAADQTAATKLWRHFFEALQKKAIAKLDAHSRPAYDEEDAVLSAFNSFCIGLAAGRFPDLQDRSSLLALLLTITGRKVSQRHRYDRRQSRDIRRTLNETIFERAERWGPGIDLQQMETCEPNPEFVVAFTDTCETFLSNFDDPKIRKIVTMRIEGYNDREIAKQLNCARSTVQRKLEIIRRKGQSLAKVDQ